MKLRTLAVFAIVTLLPSAVAAQDSDVCVTLMAGAYGTSDEDIPERIVEILTDELPQAWLCDSNPARVWIVFSVITQVTGVNIPWIAEDDDTEGLNPVIRTTLDQSGTFWVAATGFAGSSGPYDLTISVGEGDDVSPTEQKLTGELGSGDERDEDGHWVDWYSFEGHRGDSVEIRLTSRFDGVLHLAASRTPEGREIFDAYLNYYSWSSRRTEPSSVSILRIFEDRQSVREVAESFETVIQRFRNRVHETMGRR